MKSLQQKLIDCGHKLAAGKKIREIRFGLGYTCVEIDDGHIGIAWTPENKTQTCTHFDKAGSIAGTNAEEVLEWLALPSPLAKTAALATFNALNASVTRDSSDAEAISLLQLKPTDHVVMIGHFAPVIPAIKASGCRFEVVELNHDKPDVISAAEGLKALELCDVAIITSTSIINDTCDGLLQALKRNRAGVMLGPSTPMCPEAFADTRITQLSGSLVLNNDRIKQIISEGGGTRLLKQGLRFTSVMVR
jgi:uncharacterized protein (DUF4213/DUF364 family)